MQRGLNIGLASWIDANSGSTDGIPAFPLNPIPFQLRHFGKINTPEDVVRAAELALLVNRTASPGDWRHPAGGLPDYLWHLHRDTIADMITALSTLTEAQRTALARADAVLFQPDGFTISDRYALYNEARRNHEDLVLAGAPTSEVTAAYQTWVTTGHKATVEEALAIKMTLSDSTSRLIAGNDVTRIEVALDTVGSDVPFVPTLFTPVSAMSTEHWTEAEVDFQALEDAIPTTLAQTEWRRFRANKSGHVHFRYVVAELIRAWFSHEIYSADDWRLPDDSEEAQKLVADGLGTAGRLPAFYSRLYLAQVLDVRHTTVKPGNVSMGPHHTSIPPALVPLHTISRRSPIATVATIKPVGRPSGTQPPDRLSTVGRPAVSVASTERVNGRRISPASPTPQGRRKIGVVVMPRPLAVSATGRFSSTDRLSPANALAGRTDRLDSARPSANNPLAVQAANPVATTLPTSRLKLSPHFTVGSAGRLARVEMLTSVTASNRLNYVQAQLTAAASASPAPAPPPERQTYVVGLGRTNLPLCPNPNPNHLWP